MKNVLKMVTAVSLASVVLAGCGPTEYVHVGPNWDAIHNLEPSEKSFDVKILAGKSYKVGDEMSFEVMSEKDGRLWVVTVDPDDEATVLFPNDAYEDNWIEADTKVTVPPEDVDWALEAAEPTGDNVVAVIVTTGDTDLSDVIDGQEKGMEKALRIVEGEPSWGVAKKVISIKGD